MLARLRRHASLIVLLLLCGYYSIVTWAQQFPEDAVAGRALAKRIQADLKDDAATLVIVRNTQLDRAFGEAIRQELELQGRTVQVSEVRSPADASRVVTDAAKGQKSIGAIATNETISRWGPLQPDRIQRLVDEYPALAATAVMKPDSYYWPTFLTSQNLVNVINQNADIAILAIGMTMVIIAAGIDLSVGSVFALAAVSAAIAIESLGGGAAAGTVAVIGCMLLGIFVGGAAGAFNGSLSTFAGIPAFIVTLATMMIARGLALIFAVRYQKFLAGGTTEGTPEAIRIHAPSFDWLGNGATSGIPNPIWLMILLYVVAHSVMTRTAFGRYVYAVGGNREAARLSGVPVRLVLLAVYMICGVMAGIGGLVDASRFEGGRPNAGEMYELRVIAAVVVGGTSLSGGEGTIVGTLIGALIIAVIQNGLNMSGVKTYEQMIVFGALILIAALLDRLKK